MKILKMAHDEARKGGIEQKVLAWMPTACGYEATTYAYTLEAFIIIAPPGNRRLGVLGGWTEHY